MKNWMDALSNPIGNAVKKFIVQLLGAKCNPHERIVDQISRAVYNEKDYEDFGKFIAEVYEAGYMRAIDEHTAELTRLGLKVTLKMIEKPKEVEPLF